MIKMPIVFAVEEQVPVIDSSGAVVGILSALDLARCLGQLAGYAV